MSQIRFDSLHCTERTLCCGSGYGHAGKYVQCTEYTRMKNGIGLIEGTLYIRGSFVAILPFYPPAPQFLLERLWGNTNHVICIRSVYLVSCIIFFNSEAIVGISFSAMCRGSAFNRLFKRRLSICPSPGCFCPWTFFQNIGFNMVPSDPFMSHLATQLGYSAGEFQALQLIVLATFGVVDKPLASCMLVHLLEIDF